MMHPEHVETAIAAAAAYGSKVAVFADNLQEAQALARQFEDAAPAAHVERISRLNGNSYIDFYSGGRILFRSTRQSGRGLSLDRALVPITMPPEALFDIRLMLATSEDGALTGY
jgi:hypothetical protein